MFQKDIVLPDQTEPVIVHRRVGAVVRLVVEEKLERGLRFYRFEIIFFGWHCVSLNPDRSAETPVNGTGETLRSRVLLPNPFNHRTN